MVGGGVLTLAAEEETEWIHLIVRLDDLERFDKVMDSRDLPWESGYCGEGNTISFEFEGQRYFLENLMGRDFEERLAGLKQPGTSTKGFRVEFAHDSVQYDVQAQRFEDPLGAVGRRSKVELKRTAPARGIESSLRTLVEAKTMGMRIPRDEERTVEAALEQGVARGLSSKEETAALMACLSRCSAHLEEREVRGLMTSNLAEETIAKELGEKTRNLSDGAPALRRRTDEELEFGALVHLSMQVQEDTNTPELEVASQFARARLGGYNAFYTRRDLAVAKQTLNTEERIARLRAKAPALAKRQREANRPKYRMPMVKQVFGVPIRRRPILNGEPAKVQPAKVKPAKVVPAKTRPAS